MTHYKVPVFHAGAKNLGHPLAAGLIGAWLPGSNQSFRDHVGQKHMLRSGAPGSEPSRGRFGVGASASSSGTFATSGPLISGLTEFTVFTCNQQTSSSTPMMGERGSGGSPLYSLLNLGGSTLRLLFRNAAGTDLFDSTGGSYPGGFGNDAPQCFAFSARLNGTANIATSYIDGNLYHNLSSATAVGTLTGGSEFGFDHCLGVSSITGLTFVSYAWNRVLNAAEHQYVAQNPYWYFDTLVEVFTSSAFIGVTGTASITTADATLSAAGTLALKATASITTGNVTSSATGALALKATASITTADATLTATGALALKATASVTTADATLTATGAVSLKATASVTTADASLSATGSSGISGTASITTADATLTAAGALALKATASITTADATLTATGAVSLKATASITTADATLTAAGALALKATASITAGNVTLDAQGGDNLVIIYPQLQVFSGAGRRTFSGVSSQGQFSGAGRRRFTHMESSNANL